VVAVFLAAAAFVAGAALLAGAALVAFVVVPAVAAAAAAVDPRVPTAFRAVAAACLATDNASLATM
jgi:hypothetical protein